MPWPADYGGVIDLFYKIRSLHEAGIKIHLHCFTKDKAEQNLLSKYCCEVHYYPRSSFSPFQLPLPYIVHSRNDHKLLSNLSKDNHPILFEGVHTTYWLGKNKFKGRNVWLRLHNAEHEYYKTLCRQEKNIFKKLYFLVESILLKKYEASLKGKASFITVSEEDKNLFEESFGFNPVFFIPVFLPWRKVKSSTGRGSFCLYHGNLTVNENENAVRWLLENVFSRLKIPFVVAGKNPSAEIIDLAHRQTHTCIVENPSDHELEDLIRKAQINILPSFNHTGVKLKLLNALFNGRHYITNGQGISGSRLNVMSVYPETADEFITQIQTLFDKPFETSNVEEREIMLGAYYNNAKNAIDLINLIY